MIHVTNFRRDKLRFGQEAEHQADLFIEDYDEEKEEKWREEHKIKLKKHKLNERIETSEQTFDDIMKMLEEKEIMEELEDELEALEIDGEETLNMLMSGELKIQEKKRVCHSVDMEDIEFSQKKILAPKPKIDQKDVNEVDFDTNYEESDDETMPKEVLEILEKCKLLKIDEKINFLRKSIKEYENLIGSITIKCPSDLDKKTLYIEIRDYILDYIDIMKDSIDTDVEIESPNTNFKDKRRVSFAETNEIKYIDSHENDDSMFVDATSKRDVIKLDSATVLPPVRDRKKMIMDRVEQNISFRDENSSLIDFNLVDKIINTAKAKSLEIRFSHSKVQPKSNQTVGVINDPSQLIEMLTEDTIESTEETGIFSEDRRKEAYEDVRVPFSSPRKSILKNGDYVPPKVEKIEEPKKARQPQDENFNFNLVSFFFVTNIFLRLLILIFLS